ncbi:uncharacterized protein LOC126328217 [Schistocerca gregaria]|uniref:uncharacterized protein LOC126328217 n=1 Tax=Schistocerca gregaria TaxID=7010 RepID=UPI00211DCA28|nr:uncharacterized protein LOC126328217 [Schistocerca gregaria]
MILEESAWYKRFVNDFCFGEYENDLAKCKPVAVPWVRYYVSSFTFSEEEGRSDSIKWTSELISIMQGEYGLSALQELVLEGDVDTARYQLESIVKLYEDSEESRPIYEIEKSVLHYAVLTGIPEMVRMLLEEGSYRGALSLGDVVTGFTPCHLAVFVQNSEVLWELVSHGGSVEERDGYGARPIDYARMLGSAPHYRRNWRTEKRLAVWIGEEEQGELVEWEVEKLENWVNQVNKDIEQSKASENLIDMPLTLVQDQKNQKSKSFSSDSFVFIFHYSITRSYITELLFSSTQPSQALKDASFRTQYFPSLSVCSGDQHLILCYIDRTVGWGCYARRAFAPDEYIAQFAGQFISQSTQKNRRYCLSCSIDGSLLDASYYRNLSAFINHSPQPNAHIHTVFEVGIDRPIIIALRPIQIGEQICVDYGSSYFSDKSHLCSSNLMQYLHQPKMPTFLPALALSTISSHSYQSKLSCPCFPHAPPSASPIEYS